MRVAIVPTTGRDTLWQCLEAIAPQVDHIVLIAHRCREAVWDGLLKVDREGNAKVVVQAYLREVPNISEMWNLGLDEADYFSRANASMDDPLRTYVVVNDDAIVPPGFVDNVQTAMRDWSCVAASYGSPTGQPIIRRESGPHPLDQRLQGYAYALDGTAGLRVEERLAWWYSDDMLFWQAADAGGTVLLPGQVQHLHPNQSTVGVLYEQAQRDRETFISIWGRAPW